MDLLNPENLCGQNLLRIVARGSSIIAELLRLSDNVPEVFLGPDKIKDPAQLKYMEILFDFHYLREPEDYEKQINNNLDLLDLDQEFQENHEEILDRFYKLFESILKYKQDLDKYIDDVNNGFYIQHSVDNLLQENEGRQLLCEALYLYGSMLLIMEEKVPGHVREKMLVATYRYTIDGSLVNIDDVCKLCRNTGYIPGTKKPKNHPEALFARFAPDAEFVRLLIGRMQTDDIYLMANSFPNPDHRSTRLAQQASMLYVILYFAPDMLHNQKGTMREIVDKHFNDNWVISKYMGSLVDLTTEWANYSAARSALENVITTNTVKDMNQKNVSLINKSLDELKTYLTEGVLSQDYLLDNINALLNTLRSCNVSLRWRLMHRRCNNETYKKIIHDSISPQVLMTLLLNTSQFEYILKEMLQELLAEKDHAWTDGRTQAADRMTELSEYFTGEKALTRVKRDENMMKWFAGLAEQVRSLNLEEEHATKTGRQIQGLIAALEDVEQFEAVDTNLQIKSFLNEARDIFRQMIRTVNIKNEIVSIMDNITDFSYAWETLADYLGVLHERIKKDPSAVVLLRATFLKSASILDVPLVRILAIDSPDAESVAQYYSSELVEFVRLVLEVIPVTVFRVLSDIEQIQTHQLTPIPARIEAKDLRDYAQLDLRLELSKHTHQVSIFTEGVLVMEKTLLGVIQVEPRQILEEGLRRELVRLLARAMNTDLTFPDMTRQEINQRFTKVSKTLDGLKRSIEYLQDYIDIAGLKMYQQEMARIINYYTEQEANRYLKKKIFDTASRYQSKAIPIPRFVGSSTGSEETSAINFMGRVMNALFYLTDATRTVYAPECSAWFSHPAEDQKGKAMQTKEVCGIRTFALLERSLGAIGLRGLDRLLCFRAVNEINKFFKVYSNEINPLRPFLDATRSAMFPEYKVVPNATKFYSAALKKVEGIMAPLLNVVRGLGQIQLIRRQIAILLQFGCQMDAHLLYQALDNFNNGLVNDIRNHYREPEKYPYPTQENPLMTETTTLLEACGMDDPLHKIYITTHSVEGLPVILFLFLLTYLPKLEYDLNFGALLRKKAKYPLDGVPLVAGLACLLKQFHPSTTRKLIAYLGQFVRTTIQTVFGQNEVDSKAVEVPREVLNTLIFMSHLCDYASVPRSLVHEFVPPYIFDSIRYPAPTHK